MLAGRGIRLVRSLEAKCQGQNVWKKWVCLVWRRKHFPAFLVTSTTETPSVIFSRGFQESLVSIPLSDKFEINIFLSNILNKCSISSSALWFFRKDVQYFPKRNHLFIHSTKIHQAPIICQTFLQVLGIHWTFLIFWRILCEIDNLDLLLLL